MIEELPIINNNNVDSMDEVELLPRREEGNNVTISLTKQYVSDYINHHLIRNGFEWTTCPPLPLPNSFSLTMRVVADEFQFRYKQIFDEMSSQLHITPSSAYPTFMGVTDELFHEGIQWGRIVALFAFGGSIAAQSMNKEIPCLVDLIVEWVSTYIDDHLMDWINQNGSWDGFVDYYDRDVIPAEKPDSPWPTLRNFFCGVAAGAIGVLTIGAILTSRS